MEILGASFDIASEADLAALHVATSAAYRLYPHAHSIHTPSAFLVFFALSGPEVEVITPRPGSHMIPREGLMRKFEREAGIASPPQWHEEKGLIFPPELPVRASKSSTPTRSGTG